MNKLITSMICMFVGLIALITFLLLKNERLIAENEYLNKRVNEYAYKLDELTNCER